MDRTTRTVVKFLAIIAATLVCIALAYFLVSNNKEEGLDMGERYLSRIGVDILLERKNETSGEKEILMLKRAGTGYYDGYYDLPGGHLEANEDIFDGMIREAKEEIGITLKREDMEILHIYHRYKREMLKFVFKASNYEGEPVNAETQSCEKIEWIEIDNLPKNVVPTIQIELENIKNGIYYSKE